VTDESRFVDSTALAWRDSPYPGVSWKKLHHDAASGDSAVLLRFAPGASYGVHRHPAGERYFVLDGSLEDGGRTYGAGTWVEHPPGSVHKPRSGAGCVVLVHLRQPIEDLEPR
jgi:anti-sigma factor ChrR (cupin superfamily)